MKIYRKQPLAEYSVYTMEESNPSEGADLETQEFLKLFFSLRDSHKNRYEVEAAKLLKRRTLVTKEGGITFHYALNGRKFKCSTTPSRTRTLTFPFTHISLGRRKATNQKILVDRLADCEARAFLGYAVGDSEPFTG